MIAFGLGMMPASGIAISLLFLTLSDLAHLGSFVLALAIYSSASVICRPITQQYCLTHFVRVTDPPVLATISFDLIVFVWAYGAYSALCYYLGFFTNLGELLLTGVAAYFFNNGLVVGLLRAREAHRPIATTQILAGSGRICIVAIALGLQLDNVIIYFLVVDGIVWGKLAFSLISQRTLRRKVVKRPRGWLAYYFAMMQSLPTQQLDRLLLASVLNVEQIAVYFLIQRSAIVYSVISESYAQYLIPKTKRFSRSKHLGRFLAHHQIRCQITLLTVGSVACLALIGGYLGTFIDSQVLIAGIIFSVSNTVASLFFALNIMAFVYLSAYRFVLGVTIANAVFLIALLPMATLFGLIGAMATLTIQYFVINAIRLRQTAQARQLIGFSALPIFPKTL